ncbi:MULTISPECIES: GyrI-like domain-containing protein [unclassified Actinotalea]|uniref:GyrI-like domain-containing protein n=1 Tax=unclassified Actinotalea TaxID=2638618 RepID=UPI0015F5DFDD|nr:MULTISPECIES: GyrI-like domain-containing protein [unclassified Actinotalea]
MKVDLKRELGTYTARRGTFSLVTVPPASFLMVDGHGDPNTSSAYRDAVSSLYPLAYALKFLSKVELGRDYTVMPLEALWWAQDMAAFTSRRDKAQWDWTLMILAPSWLGAEHVEAARATVARKGGAPTLDDVRLEELDEGLSVQTLHVGPYDDEGPVLDALHHEFVPAQGLSLTGRHHEIYLSDPRRTAPARLRTILRQPVTR